MASLDEEGRTNMKAERVCACVLVAAALVVVPALHARAQAPKPVASADTGTHTAAAVSIDKPNRHLVLKNNKDGKTETITVPPEVERFDAIKVGDVITARYIESALIRLVDPNEPASSQAAAEVGLTRRPGEKPGGTIAKQVNVKVKVKAIDKAAPSLTVEVPSGDVVSFKVEDKKRLEKLKVGDQIDITYTEALMITVDPAKKGGGRPCDHSRSFWPRPCA